VYARWRRASDPDPIKGMLVPCEQPLGRSLIGRRAGAVGLAGDVVRPGVSLLERRRDRLRVDPLLAQLLAERTLAARTGAVA
jgi:hypothetical protein